MLSAAAVEHGWHVFPIDHLRNRFSTKVAVLCQDLASPKAISWLRALINLIMPSWIHAGLPCGTCSRARDRPVSAAAQAQGAPSPRPLRNARFPLGLPNLSTSESARVEKANAVYTTFVHFMYLAFRHDVAITIENPEHSWLWCVLSLLVKQLAADKACSAFADWFFNMEDVYFDMCCHGGSRRKGTRVRANSNALQALSARCQQDPCAQAVPGTLE